jgi:hypothetical protein
MTILASRGRAVTRAFLNRETRLKVIQEVGSESGDASMKIVGGDGSTSGTKAGRKTSAPERAV